jgi:hypothetical protein
MRDSYCFAADDASQIATPQYLDPPRSLLRSTSKQMAVNV